MDEKPAKKKEVNKEEDKAKNPFNVMLTRKYSYKWSDPYTDFKAVITKNPVIAVNHLSEIVTFLFGGGKTSLFYKTVTRHSHWNVLLNELITKYELSKKDIAKIFTTLEKMECCGSPILKNPFDWIKKLEKDGYIDSDKLILLFKLGYKIEYDQDEYNFTKDQINEMFGTEKVLHDIQNTPDK